MSKRVKQGGLAGIGVSHQRNGRNWSGFAALALLRADAADVLQLLLQVPHAARDFTAISFEFRFAGTTGADPAAELRHLHAMTHQPRHHVLQLCQFNLELAFSSSRVARENIEDELRTVDDAALNDLLNVALLGWAEIVVKQKHIGIDRRNSARDF